eukprot:gene570-6011_t
MRPPPAFVPVLAALAKGGHGALAIGGFQEAPFWVGPSHDVTFFPYSDVALLSGTVDDTGGSIGLTSANGTFLDTTLHFAPRAAAEAANWDHRNVSTTLTLANGSARSFAGEATCVSMPGQQILCEELDFIRDPPLYWDIMLFGGRFRRRDSPPSPPLPAPARFTDAIMYVGRQWVDYAAYFPLGETHTLHGAVDVLTGGSVGLKSANGTFSDTQLLFQPRSRPVNPSLPYTDVLDISVTLTVANGSATAFNGTAQFLSRD